MVERLISDPPGEIDTLLLEGTTVGREGLEREVTSESDVEDALTSTFRRSMGLALVHASAQNIDRMVSIFRACLRSERTLLVDLYAALILEATGNHRIPQSHWDRVALCVPHFQRLRIKEESWFDVLGRHSVNRVYADRQVAKTPERFALLFRPLWQRDLERAGCLDGAVLIHSQWQGYLTEPRFQALERWREERGIGFEIIHTSGHAGVGDLRRLAEALDPGKVVPIHTTCPEGFASIHERVVRHSDGEWWEV